MTTTVQPSAPARALSYLRQSADAYVVALVVTFMSAAYANYLKDRIDSQGFVLFGQAPAVYLPFFLLPIAVVLWILYRPRRRTPGWSWVFLGGLTISWLVHFAIIHAHGDLYPHTIWLFVPVLAMLAWKPPSSASAWRAIVAIAWLAAAIIVLTMVLEKVGAVPEFFNPDKGAIAWENARYWLPLRDLFGLEGRWNGPFGYNSKTGFFAVFITIVGLIQWRRWGAVLVVVGVITILLTGGRGVFLSLTAGLAVLVLFSPRSPLSRIPAWVRVTLVGIPVLAVGIGFLMSPLSTTGRIGENGIWTSFVDLWQSSIWVGVGQAGIWNSTGRAHDAMDAHSIFIQELAKFGLVGFVAIYLVLLVGIAIALMAAMRGWPNPLAVLALYFVAGFTDLLHDGWQSQSTYTLMVTLCVLGASMWLSEARSPADDS